MIKIIYNSLYAENDRKSKRIYDMAMIFFIIASLVPLAFKQNLKAFTIIDKSCAIIFIIDYILRWMCCKRISGKGNIQFLKYPLTPMALIDALSILPSIVPINSGFKILRIVRMARAMRVLRAFKFVRYSKNADIIFNTIKNQRKPLGFVLALACFYVSITSIIIFNVEPDTFNTFFDAIYWSVVSLTTMGYGDIYPVSTAGRMITMASSIFGIAIVALPSGIITAGYMEEISKSNDVKEETEK